MEGCKSSAGKGETNLRAINVLQSRVETLDPEAEALVEQIREQARNLYLSHISIGLVADNFQASPKRLASDRWGAKGVTPILIDTGSEPLICLRHAEKIRLILANSRHKA